MDDIPIQNVNQLQKQVRILEKQLQRSTIDRVRLEVTVQNKESVLRRVIQELQDYQLNLERQSCDLEAAFNELKRMQDQLIETEKMAALGSLVAGVAHEINTPVGTSLTLASTLCDETKKFQALTGSGTIKRSAINQYLEIAEESTRLILINLQRVGELVQSFKQVSVDQSTAEQRTFNLKFYLAEILTTLMPVLKPTGHRIQIVGDDQIEIHNYPGALAQVVTNLVMNSLTHAYGTGEAGNLQFELGIMPNDQVFIHYRDDGCGIPDTILDKIFNPFFTTARDKGGTGLGLHITYNLVTQKLQGQIDVQSQVGQGTSFQIQLPRVVST